MRFLEMFVEKDLALEDLGTKVTVDHFIEKT
jgi:hypothetical protein